MAAETESVDVLARVLAVLGGLVGLASLGLQYIRHRGEKPKLQVEVKLDDGMPPGLDVLVRNVGKTDVGVNHWEIQAVGPPALCQIVRSYPRNEPLPGDVPGLNFVAWSMVVHPYLDNAETARFQIVITPVGGREIGSFAGLLTSCQTSL